MYASGSLSRHDWIISGLRWLKLNHWTCFLAVLAFNLIVNLFLAFTLDLWQATPEKPGLNREPGGWAIDLVVIPAMLSFYLWLNYAADDFLGLPTSEAHDTKQSDKHVERFRRVVTSRWLGVLGFIAGTAIMITAQVLLFTGSNPTWSNQSIIVFVVRSIIVWPAYIAIIIALVYLAVLVYTYIRVMLTSELSIHPVHPDNAGGFGSQGAFIWRLSAYVSGVFIALTFGVLAQDYINRTFYDAAFSTLVWRSAMIVSVIIFLIVTMLIIALTWITSRKMRETRKAALTMLSDQIDDLMNASLEQVRQGSIPSSDQLEQLRTVHALVAQYPIWPFNAAQVSGLVGSFIGFTLSIVLQEAIGRLLQ